MNTHPLVTFIVPAYNVEDYLAEAVESVRMQTVEDWEMIIVDDGSTDRTYDIAKDFARNDARIKVIKMDFPSGSAYQPRKKAIEMAQTDFIAPLDADDYIEPDYLRRLLAEKEVLDVEAIYPTMYINENDVIVPKMSPVLCGKAMAGKDCVVYTLDGWRINCNGGIINRNLYMHAYEKFDSSLSYSCADELLTRQLLWLINSVAFSTAAYNYRVNPESITHARSAKQFDYMINNRVLLNFVTDRFGIESEEYIRAALQNFHGIADGLRLLRKGGYSADAYCYAKSQVAKCYSLVDWRLIWKYDSKIYWWSLRGGSRIGSFALRLIDTAKSLIHNKRGRNVLKQTVGSVGRKSLSLFRIGYLNTKGFINQVIETSFIARKKFKPGSQNDFYVKRYYNGTELQHIKEGIICICDGTLCHGGPTDRLRGILSTYEEANKHNIPFYISWTSPFALEDYLVPATFDWRINKTELSRSLNQTYPLIIEDIPNVQSAMRLKAALYKRKPQTHVFTNSDSSIGHYASLWNKLFHPSEILQKEIDKHLAHLGNKYQAFTFRFLQLLGDFKDWQQVTLPEEEAIILMEKVKMEFLRLATAIPSDYRILVTSDSTRFLKYIRNADDRIYIVPGDVKNIDLLNGESHETAWLKTFTDQQLLMKAEKVTLMRTNRMYKSGFPRFAAEVGRTEFIDYKF